MSTVDINIDHQIFFTGGYPGNHIDFSSWNDGASTQEIFGHATPKPRDGDILQSIMRSGREALFVIHNLHSPGDPPDLFFAEASFIGYKDENPLLVVESQKSLCQKPSIVKKFRQYLSRLLFIKRN